MKRIGMMGCMLAVIAVSAVVAATASAALPELGRCVKVAPKTGEYTGASCVNAGKGAWDWLPGPGALKKFTGTGEATTLETVGKVKIECTASSFAGEYTGAKTATVTITFVGCTNSVTKKLCGSTVKEGEFETQPLEGEIGFIKDVTPIVAGLDLKKAPLVATFECGKLPEAVTLGTLEGSVIGALKRFNRMVEEQSLTYKALGGKQVPEQFEGGTKDTLTMKLVTGLTTTTEEAGLKAKVEIANEEPMEIKVK
jgi:hypothetical protein